MLAVREFFGPLFSLLHWGQGDVVIIGALPNPLARRHP
jgi:hypothetical protein